MTDIPTQQKALAGDEDETMVEDDEKARKALAGARAA